MMSMNRLIGYVIVVSFPYLVLITQFFVKEPFLFFILVSSFQFVEWLKFYFYDGKWPNMNPTITKQDGIRMVRLLLFVIGFFSLMVIFHETIEKHEDIFLASLFAVLFVIWIREIEKGWKKYRLRNIESDESK